MGALMHERYSDLIGISRYLGGTPKPDYLPKMVVKNPKYIPAEDTTVEDYRVLFVKRYDSFEVYVVLDYTEKGAIEAFCK